MKIRSILSEMDGLSFTSVVMESRYIRPNSPESCCSQEDLNGYGIVYLKKRGLTSVLL